MQLPYHKYITHTSRIKYSNGTISVLFSYYFGTFSQQLYLSRKVDSFLIEVDSVFTEVDFCLLKRLPAWIYWSVPVFFFCTNLGVSVSTLFEKVSFFSNSPYAVNKKRDVQNSAHLKGYL